MVQPSNPNNEMVNELLSHLTTTIAETQSPLRHFKGRLANILGDQGTSQRDGRAYLTLHFHFDRLTVWQSEYNFPWGTAILNFNWSDPSKSPSPASPLGMFLMGIDRLLLKTDTKVTDLIGHELEIKFTPNHKARRRNETTEQWDDVSLEAFEIIGIDNRRDPKHLPGGVAPAQPTQATAPESVPYPVVTGTLPWEVATDTAVSVDTLLARLANGKQASEFALAALTSPEVQALPNVYNLITTNHLPVLQKLVDGKFLRRDDNLVYHLL